MTLLVLLFVFVFLVGLTAGSFINVCASRLPYEKSVLWPLGSRCGTCFQPIRWYDNIPILSYLILRGRCRTCRAPFALRYLLIELGTGLVLIGLLYLEMIVNCLDLPMLRDREGGLFPPQALCLFGHHAILVCFLLTASVCDLMEMEIPLPITLVGTLVGLLSSTLLPWPAPENFPPANLITPTPPFLGAVAWPVWYPLPSALPAGSWQLGLVTGLAGALAGMLVLRLVAFLFRMGRGVEGLGVGDADLMMMAGAFIGWQPVVVAFLVAVFPGLIFALCHLAFRGEHALPFGPSLSLGVVITILCWPALGGQLQFAFFDPVFMGFLGISSALALLLVSALLRLL